MAMPRHSFARGLSVLIGLLLACVTAALVAGMDPDWVCLSPPCATLDGVAALMGAEAKRWLLAAVTGMLALGFTYKGLRSQALASITGPITPAFSPTPAQLAICKRYQSDVVAYAEHDMIAIAMSTLGEQPIYGSRTRKLQDRVTWFFHCGEFSGDEDFYKPVHLRHAVLLLPEIKNYLCLAPGFRLIIDAKGHEEVRRDSEPQAEAELKV